MANEVDKWKELRAPFDPKVIGKIPKGGVQLDYVGHAAVTDSLLTVDPSWTWEPVAFGPDGLPAYDAKGGLWIRLTVLGVTRLGYGDGPDPKQRIGDAIRNAAMRFGVALDLWTKDELESQLAEPKATAKTPATVTKPVPAEDPKLGPAQLGALLMIAKSKGYIDKTAAAANLAVVIGKAITEVRMSEFKDVLAISEQQLLPAEVDKALTRSSAGLEDGPIDLEDYDL